ncbi:MAG: hypothetical protein EZS28_000360 [Streblomastix strix]|uniref:NrS-1 polymerase-like helicase domain-containing protein n=1 Tax=Streblomastix strix TaxID=222440 RepID=A0A5J4XBC0_9EUKA|nr:MAG: hypothetical protein EZS28_000360 [Streblomastix strix]
MVHLANRRDILDKWNVDIEISYIEYIEKKQRREFEQQIADDGTIDLINNELAQAYIDGLKNLTILNYPLAVNLIKDTIAIGDERVYEYILNWIAWMIQNPGKKFRAEIILQGRQGIGKNRFTDAIAELNNRFSCLNITNIDDFTGKLNFAVENKMLSVLNVVRNYDTKKSVATAMKSTISDQIIRINEKNQPRRTAENVLKIIYVSNADSLIQLDTVDRRHLVYVCKTVHYVIEDHIEDIEYFNELSQSYTDEFYEN